MQQLDEGACDPAALAQLYTQAMDLMLLPSDVNEEDEDVVRCRRRAAELLESFRSSNPLYSAVAEYIVK